MEEARGNKKEHKDSMGTEILLESWFKYFISTD